MSINKKFSNDSLLSMPPLIQTGIRLAKSASRQCSGRYCIGACAITKGARQFYTGFCTHRTHPLQKKFATESNLHKKISLHAEIDALSKIRNNNDPIECLVVIRTLLKAQDIFAPSKPCDICLSAIMSFEVNNLVYFNDDKWNYVEL